MAEHIIKLVKPIVWHTKTYDRVILREPSFDDVLDLGDLNSVAITPEGTRVIVANNATMREYISRCLVEPKSVEALAQGGARLMLDIKQWLNSFFQLAGPVEDGNSSESSPTSSSSNDMSQQTE